ncbi:MAG: hypothetical protein H8E66_14095 [Planctomycetes bacterium]|nr:hypothetical protein [Planctomycetota bacterium]
MQSVLLLCALPSAFTQLSADEHAPQAFETGIKPLLAKYCFNCQSGDDPKCGTLCRGSIGEILMTIGYRRLELQTLLDEHHHELQPTAERLQQLAGGKRSATTGRISNDEQHPERDASSLQSLRD